MLLNIIYWFRRKKYDSVYSCIVNNGDTLAWTEDPEIVEEFDDVRFHHMEESVQDGILYEKNHLAKAARSLEDFIDGGLTLNRWKQPAYWPFEPEDFAKLYRNDVQRVKESIFYLRYFLCEYADCTDNKELKRVCRVRLNLAFNRLKGTQINCSGGK